MAKRSSNVPNRQGSAAIRVGAGGSVRITNSAFVGFDTGVRVEAGGAVEARNNAFVDVGQAFDVARGARADITGTRITRPGTVPETKGTSVGWRRPSGPPLPAMCPDCKSIFPSRNYNIGSSRFYSRDNEESCLACGSERAKLADGLFDLADETIKVLCAPDVTHAMLVGLSSLAKGALADDTLPTEEVLAGFARIVPGLKPIIAKVGQYGVTARSYLSLFVALAALYYAVDSRDIAKQQVEIGQQQVRLQVEANSSGLDVDKIVAEVLRHLSAFTISIEPRREKPDIPPAPPEIKNSEPKPKSAKPVVIRGKR